MKDCRRIPTGGEFMEDKAISDLLYAWLQCNSRWRQGESHRYIDKKEVKMARLARGLGCARQTLTKQMNLLIAKGFVLDEEDGYYKLPPIGDYYFLVPAETLRYLLDTRSANVIKAYCYIGNMYHFYGKKAYFTQNSLLKAIGYTPKQTKNHEFIRNILFTLEKDKLIKVEREFMTVEDGVTFKIYRIKNVSKVVEGLNKYDK